MTATPANNGLFSHEIERLEALAEAMRPVVEAAIAYTQTYAGRASDEERYSRDERLRDLFAAKRAYCQQAGPQCTECMQGPGNDCVHFTADHRRQRAA